MYDLGSMIDFLLLAGLLAIAVKLFLWLVQGSDAPAGGLFGMRFDAWSPVVPEEVDPLPWKIELIGDKSSVPSALDTLLPDLQDAA